MKPHIKNTGKEKDKGAEAAVVDKTKNEELTTAMDKGNTLSKRTNGTLTARKALGDWEDESKDRGVSIDVPGREIVRAKRVINKIGGKQNRDG